MPAPEWGSFLFIVDGFLNWVPVSDLRQVVLEELMTKNRGLAVRLSCNQYFRFFQCKILIYVYKLKLAISALFWTVLVSVNQEFL